MTKNFVRMTVYLTKEQRKWLKKKHGAFFDDKSCSSSEKVRRLINGQINNKSVQFYEL